MLSAAPALLVVSLALSSTRISAIPLDQFYPYGVGAGDSFLAPTDDGSSGVITLRRVFPFYGGHHFVIVVRMCSITVTVGEIVACSTGLGFDPQ